MRKSFEVNWERGVFESVKGLSREYFRRGGRIVGCEGEERGGGGWGGMGGCGEIANRNFFLIRYEFIHGL